MQSLSVVADLLTSVLVAICALINIYRCIKYSLIY